ncbi:phage holin family protein [Paracidovorax valerianellae]|uniref:Putative Holin-X, holin superfamily III n=1 Tax=Paracidovorax valerianellae TaxID=187868 RepID=A0A1G6I8S4_9BURK|nr:phage holin family protein [Paracidovorax valerianellae]MDA8447982.1 phage holin family protein [Paracidovorax valerianellae]SDC02425.1 Putative Holin-X, holin superfamily III [Paracidovorax valerianellae]
MNWLALLGLDGWVARWRAAVIEGAIAAEDRLDLARLEWADQKRRLGLMVVLVIALGGLTVVTMVLASLAILVQFWDSPQRTMVGWLVAGTWLVLWAGALIALVSIARKAGNAFALTRQELAQDWRDIKERL